MTLYQLFGVLGVPSVFAVVAFLWRQVVGIKMGVKALLRAQMIADFNLWSERGYAPLYAKQNFENLWQQYHVIKGPNGVMDNIHVEFLALPHEKPTKEEA